MGNCFVACLNGATTDERKNPSSGIHMIGSKNVRTSLSKDRPTNPSFLHRRKDGGDGVKRSCSKPMEMGVLRVKIMLTKEEAAILLSKCEGEEGTLEDFVSEIQRLGRDDLSTAVSGPCGDSWRPVLETIPEHP